jgi:hypothetical protein
MARGKYAEAGDDDIIDRALMAFSSKAVGIQLRPDANMFMQLKGFEDLKKDAEIRTDDMKKTKIKWEDAVMVYKALDGLKPQEKSKYVRLLQKDQRTFKKTFKYILDIIKRG